jgi:hypothetical protein
MPSEEQIKGEMGVLLKIYLDPESPAIKKECAHYAYVALRWAITGVHFTASDYIKTLRKELK